MGKIKNLTINTNKINTDEIHILLVSDLHLTMDAGFKNLDKIITSKYIDYDALDYVVIPGDLINDSNELENYEFRKKFLNKMTKLTQDKTTIVSYGNHDQMTKLGSIDEKWIAGDRKLLEDALKELPNIKIVKNGQKAVETKEIDFAGFSPLYSYYEGLHEDKKEYEKNFFANYKEDLFSEDKFNIYLTHEPQSIIRLSKERGYCLQPNTDIVLSGHMHNGLLPNTFHKFAKNRGLISPQMQLFPEFAQGEFQVENTKFIINGPVNTRIETPQVNDLYGANASVLTLKKVR